MTILALVVASVSLFIALITAASLVEVYNRVQLVSDYARVSGDPVTLDITAIGDKPSAHGLPLQLDKRSGVVLFLSPRCATCHTVAKSLKGNVPDQLYLIVTEAEPEMCNEWIDEYGLASPRTIVDEGGLIADSAGVRLTPLGMVLADGQFVAAMSVPTSDSLFEILEAEPPTLTTEEAL